MDKIIVIPVYKFQLSAHEKMSLVQCCQILNKHKICIVCPESLDVRNYEDVLLKYEVNYKIEKFSSLYFVNIDKYNELMLSSFFYERFIQYEYMLIYQLDAYVFNDKLDYWCEQGYDYIGAPWFEGLNLSNNSSKLLNVAGNGGFSLRKIPSFVRLLNFDTKAKDFITDYINKKQYEDIFFSKYASKIDGSFSVASPEIAMKFSFECMPRRLYRMNNDELPFGCHAWEKYDPIFWGNFIDLGFFKLSKMYFVSRKIYYKSKIELHIQSIKNKIDKIYKIELSYKRNNISFIDFIIKYFSSKVQGKLRRIVRKIYHIIRFKKVQ